MMRVLYLHDSREHWEFENSDQSGAGSPLPVYNGFSVEDPRQNLVPEACHLGEVSTGGRSRAGGKVMLCAILGV